MEYKYFKIKIIDLTEEILRLSSSGSAYNSKRSLDGKFVLLKFPFDKVPAKIFQTGYEAFSSASILEEINNGEWSENYQIIDNSTPKDSDGSILQRIKITTTGWHYQLHGIEFETSKLNSIYSKKIDNTDYGFTNIKFYELLNETETQITGDNLTQEYLDSNCIKTIIDWEPHHDLEMIGGVLKQKSIPSENIRMWVIGAPDVPEIYGGSKAFVVNANLVYIGVEEGIKADGRAPKYLTYDSNYHTNKIRLIFRHSAGFKHKMTMIFELFKP